MLTVLLTQDARQLEYLPDARVGDPVGDLASTALRSGQAAPPQACQVVRDRLCGASTIVISSDSVLAFSDRSSPASTTPRPRCRSRMHLA